MEYSCAPLEESDDGAGAVGQSSLPEVAKKLLTIQRPRTSKLRRALESTLEDAGVLYLSSSSSAAAALGKAVQVDIR